MYNRHRTAKSVTAKSFDKSADNTGGDTRSMFHRLKPKLVWELEMSQCICFVLTCVYKCAYFVRYEQHFRFLTIFSSLSGKPVKKSLQLPKIFQWVLSYRPANFQSFVRKRRFALFLTSSRCAITSSHCQINSG